jgi:hypothetical protein
MRQEAKAVGRAIKGIADVSIKVIGIGATRLPPIRASRVILAGLAGGLDPELRTGDVIVEPYPPTLPLGARGGRMHTSASLVCAPAQKSAIFVSTGAACVDMESDIVRRAANAARVPLTMVRAVLDTADQPLPEYLLKLTTPTGRIRPFPLAALLLRRPSTLRELRQLRRSSRIALDALGNAVRDLLTDT